MPSLKIPPAFVISRAPIVNKDGTASWDFLKILQTMFLQINNALNQLGQFVGIISADATISSRSDTIGTALSKIETGGILSTDNFTDGVGSPLAGGITAFQALVDSSPVSGNVLKYSGTDWTPGDAPGITELTGDGTAGPGSGSQVFTLEDTGVTPGNYTNTNLTVDGKGRVTAAADGPAGFVNPMTTQGDLIVGGAAGAAQRLAAGTAGNVLTSNGPGTLPSYQPGTSGGVSSLNSLTGALAITGDSSITVTPSGSSIALHATGGSLAAPVEIDTGSPTTKGLIIKGNTTSGLQTPELIQQNSRAGTFGPDTLAFLSPNTAGNSIVVLGIFNNGALTITDSNGNTYAHVFHGPSDDFLDVYVASAIAGGANTVTASGGENGFVILEYSNLAASPFDVGSVASGFAGPGTLPTGSITTTAPGDLLLVAGFGVGAISESGGRTLIAGNPATGNYAVWAAIAATAGAYSDAITTSSSAQLAGIVALKAFSETADQTANLEEWQQSDGTVLSAVNGAGQHVQAQTSGSPSTTPSLGATAFDPATNKLWIYGSAGWKSVSLI